MLDGPSRTGAGSHFGARMASQKDSDIYHYKLRGCFPHGDINRDHSFESTLLDLSLREIINIHKFLVLAPELV